ncbi:hypothetical protein Hypma_002766 [Hypsizygus marmoreus]|uniref:Uncharacterized protein n=1 Tax=Hypsizygus marmoreus TaxID=39966 RepID=A0A369J3J6_HYPMA|nr:hypothetical protein Hypma_002766 [Hypsizygus marmoreus]
MKGSRKVSNLELALMLANINPSSETRGCTQCSREVPKTQLLLTCEQCRESQKRKKQRRKERKLAEAAEGGTGDASKKCTRAELQAIIDKHEMEEALAKAKQKGKKKRISNASEIDEEDIESTTARLKAEFAAAKGVGNSKKQATGSKRKAVEVQAMDWDFGLKRQRMDIENCLPIARTGSSKANVSSIANPSDHVLEAHKRIMGDGAHADSAPKALGLTRVGNTSKSAQSEEASFSHHSTSAAASSTLNSKSVLVTPSTPAPSLASDTEIKPKQKTLTAWFKPPPKS